MQNIMYPPLLDFPQIPWSCGESPYAAASAVVESAKHMMALLTSPNLICFGILVLK